MLVLVFVHARVDVFVCVCVYVVLGDLNEHDGTVLDVKSDQLTSQ